MTEIWRLNIKTDAQEGIDPRKFCIERKLLGIGWPVEGKGQLDWDQYYKLAEEAYYKNGDRGWWPAINAIKNRIEVNDLCWTRDWDGIYYIGRVTSEWRYENKDEYLKADVVNIRDCGWIRVGLVDAVPGKIVSSFIPRRTLQRVDDETTALYSMYLYSVLASFKYEIPTKSVDLLSLMSSEDCEDLVGLYMQENGYRMIPSSCKQDTAAYEFVMKHVASGKPAVAQVKKQAGPLDVSPFSDTAYEPYEVFLFNTCGIYTGRCSSNVHCIEPEIIRDFIAKNSRILSDRIQNWVRISEEVKKPAVL